MNLFGLWRQNCSVCSSWFRPSSLPWDSRGKYISPAPPFLTLCRAFISRGLRPYRPRRPTHRPLRGLRQRAFSPLRSHPLRGAYRAFFTGRQCCFISHTRYYAQSRLYCDILSDQVEGTLAHINVLTVLNPLLFPLVQQLEFLRRANRAFQ